MENEVPSGLRLLGVASVVPFFTMVISLALKAESEPCLPALSISAGARVVGLAEVGQWHLAAEEDVARRRRLGDDLGRRAGEAAAGRVVENVQLAVASLIASMNEVPVEFDAPLAVMWSPGFTTYGLASATDRLGYISYQA